MNVNIYLEDALGQNLDNFAKELGKPRNLIIREAIKMWIDTHAHNDNWPESILNFQGITDFLPFESHRTDLLPPNENIFK